MMGERRLPVSRACATDAGESPGATLGTLVAATCTASEDDPRGCSELAALTVTSPQKLAGLPTASLEKAAIIGQQTAINGTNLPANAGRVDAEL